MLWALVLILLALHLLGLISPYDLAGYLHLLLVAAIVLALASLFRGRAVA